MTAGGLPDLPESRTSAPGKARQTSAWPEENAMKLYDGGRAPNPRRVRIFLSEKGVSLPLEPVDIGKQEHRAPGYTAVNPLQLLPALALDDGTIITESIAICRYVEALHPAPPLFGTSPVEQAQIEMWQRIVELQLYEAVRAVFRHLHPALAALEVPQVAAWGEANKDKVYAALTIIERQLEGRDFLCGAFSVADITGLVTLDFMKPAKLAIPDALVNTRRWHASLAARPSARA
jgi:glutathione S-transferase